MLTKLNTNSEEANTFTKHSLFLHKTDLQNVLYRTLFVLIQKCIRMLSTFISNCLIKDFLYENSFIQHYSLYIESLKNTISLCKVKVKVTLVQALRLCTGRTANRGSRGIALLFHDQRH